ncbi:MAG: epoxyqueuosine reductase QueH [Treponema sp.]|jgi:predicted adenine nucleotide alpha hydrolase (AANH) superfamily ATPase|nr:epoxyqueuosine reductase QueH [Treponema sp.]
MRLLFHCCCAPCTAACLETLSSEGIVLRLFWYNPNIHPFTEYKSRRDALLQYTASQNMETEMSGENGGYGLRVFLRSLGGTGGGNDDAIARPARCESCYRLRLEKTAAHAAQNGFNGFSTSLLVSPYQDHEAIRRIGGEAAARYGTAFLYRDFRPRFREGQERARSLGLYMQKYCGCIFSEEERYAKHSKKQEPSP